MADVIITIYGDGSTTAAGTEIQTQELSFDSINEALKFWEDNGVPLKRFEIDDSRSDGTIYALVGESTIEPGVLMKPGEFLELED